MLETVCSIYGRASEKLYFAIYVIKQNQFVFTMCKWGWQISKWNKYLLIRTVCLFLSDIDEASVLAAVH